MLDRRLWFTRLTTVSFSLLFLSRYLLRRDSSHRTPVYVFMQDTLLVYPNFEFVCALWALTCGGQLSIGSIYPSRRGSSGRSDGMESTPFSGIEWMVFGSSIFSPCSYNIHKSPTNVSLQPSTSKFSPSRLVSSSKPLYSITQCPQPCLPSGSL